MPSEEQDAPLDQQPQDENTTEDSGRIEDLPVWAQRIIKETRDEAAKRRLEYKRLEDEARRREQTRLAEEGRWKELAETRAAELADLSPYRERAETLEKMIRANNEARIERVPEELRGLVPVEYAPERLSSWLDANWERLSKRPAPDIDAGAGGGGAGKAMNLTAEEKQAAKRFGMTDEQYAVWKLRANKS
jgi:phage I-like protein